MNRLVVFAVAGALMVTPAFAAGPGNDFTFVIDETQSSITFSFVGIGTSGTSPLSGTFDLNLTGNAGNWDGNADLEDVDAVSTAHMDFGSLFIFGDVLPGDFAMSDLDSTDPGSGFVGQSGDQVDVPPFGTMAAALAGVNPASGTTSGDVFVDTNGDLSIFGSADTFDLYEWALPLDSTFLAPAIWSVTVADHALLGSTVPGDIDGHVVVTAFVPTGDPFADPVVRLDIDLLGTAIIPEPATLAVLGLGVLGLLLRRRRAV